MGFTASGTTILLAIVPGPGLLFGLMLLAAIVGGYGARWLHLPRVVGYLIGGAVLRVVLHALVVTDEGGVSEQQLQAAAEPLDAIRDLALGLILFTIGGVFERSRVRAGGRSVLTVSVFESGLSFLFVTVGCFVVAVIAQGEVDIRSTFSLALLLGLASIATAPAATLFVLQEYEAKGRITETILGLTGTNNVLCLILFYATFLILTSLGMVVTTGPAAQRIWVALGVTIVGSLVLGVGCGTLISIVHGKLPLEETMHVYFAM